jgi:hypothetical protein
MINQAASYLRIRPSLALTARFSALANVGVTPGACIFTHTQRLRPWCFAAYSALSASLATVL